MIAPKRPRLKKARAAHRAYHVVHDRELDRWEVHREDGRTGQSAHALEDAIALAIADAEHDHAEGWDVVVCVEREDGGARLVWHSPARFPG